MKKSIILLILLFSINALGQSLAGIIIDSENKSLSYVHILNSNTNDHTHSNENGDFTLQNVNINDTIKFTHLGYESEELVIANLSNSLTVRLKDKLISLGEVVIASKINALNAITEVDIQTRPVNSSQEVLRQVPGLFIGQHAGGGKAEQMFLRGFDIDHGTDIALSVDGLPINMVSHAHGQGYADLHFIIPETINKIDFGKGPYYAHQGNFNTAGYVNFKTKQQIDNSLLKVERGQFNTNRILGMLKILNNKNHQTFFASEYLTTNGPFESPQHFNRVNLFVKHTSSLSEFEKISITASHFKSKWDASGQIPNRAVEQGLTTRFGAIDNTEGGQTSRSNIVLKHQKFLNDHTYLQNSFYFSNYNFELYSNFTFFLEDPINGDQIRQKESRNLLGFSTEYYKAFNNDKLDGNWKVGLSLRNDQSTDNELSHTLNRKTILNQIQLGDINETNLGAYINADLNFNKWTINAGLRWDYFDFQYNDALSTNYQTQAALKNIVSPKLNILYNYSPSLQLYLKSGRGFHSNDTRVILEQRTEQVLPSAYGVDLGLMWKPMSRMLLNVAYWHLYSEQEFVYVGDAGIVEPSGKSQRQGLDLSARYQILDWLFWNVDINYTYARAINDEAINHYIPLAPDFTWLSGISVIHPSGFYGGTQIRHLKDRPANEDNSIVAKGYTIVDANVGYRWKSFDFGINIQNLLNAEWNETQFATESQLQNEPIPVEEIHFTPGTPFFLKGVVEYKF